MIGVLEYDVFAEAYAEGIDALLSEGRRVEAVLDDSSVGSQFGTAFRPTLELSPHVFRVRDPAACLVACGPRQPSLSYMVGQWLWTMTGSDDVEYISYYNARGQVFSEDGSRLAGAFGARMRRNAGDQLGRALDTLRRDPASRRAAIVIAEPADGRSPMRDHPCALALHLTIRDGRLEMITTMRSQSALMVLPYDVALFMTLHVWAAAELGLPCGPHTWMANSFHIYEDELPLASRVREQKVESYRLPDRVATQPARVLEQLEDFEYALRTAAVKQAPVSSVPLPDELADPEELHGAFAAVLVAYAASSAAHSGERASAQRSVPRSWRPLWRTQATTPALT